MPVVSNGLPAVLIGVSIALIQPQIAVALSAAEVGKIAEQITVLIEGSFIRDKLRSRPVCQ